MAKKTMSERLSPQSCFTFTEREQLYDQVSHARLLALVMQPDVDVHAVALSSNSFGEFLFISLSCQNEQPRKLLTFWGAGYHDHRERWIIDTWQWYESQRTADSLSILSKEAAYAQIKDREAFVRSQTTPTPPSERAKLYELLADLTDEDGALAELEDWGWLFFVDNEEE